VSERRLFYLYMGSDDVGADVVFYRDHLGGELVWRFQASGTEVAAVRLGDPSGNEIGLLERARPGVLG
jgi:hypothetical protein